MPTYSYVCRGCGHAFDVQQAFTDDALTTCPECEGSLRKVFSAVGVVFKGSGFYRTDSRGSGPSSANGQAPASSTEGGGKGTDKGSGPSGEKSGTSPASSSSGSSSAASSSSSSTPSASTSSSSTAAG